jgi:hypothetical protein
MRVESFQRLNRDSPKEDVMRGFMDRLKKGRGVLVALGALAAIAGTSVVTATPAKADGWRGQHWDRGHHRGDWNRWERDRWRRIEAQRWREARWRDRYYNGPRYYYPPAYYAPPVYYSEPGVSLGFTFR